MAVGHAVRLPARPDPGREGISTWVVLALGLAVQPLFRPINIHSRGFVRGGPSGYSSLVMEPSSRSPNYDACPMEGSPGC